MTFEVGIAFQTDKLAGYYVPIRCSQHGYSQAHYYSRETISRMDILPRLIPSLIQHLTLQKHERLHRNEHKRWQRGRTNPVITSPGVRPKRRRVKRQPERVNIMVEERSEPVARVDLRK